MAQDLIPQASGLCALPPRGILPLFLGHVTQALLLSGLLYTPGGLLLHGFSRFHQLFLGLLQLGLVLACHALQLLLCLGALPLNGVLLLCLGAIRRSMLLGDFKGSIQNGLRQRFRLRPGIDILHLLIPQRLNFRDNGVQLAGCRVLCLGKTRIFCNKILQLTVSVGTALQANAYISGSGVQSQGTNVRPFTARNRQCFATQTSQCAVKLGNTQLIGICDLIRHIVCHVVNLVPVHQFAVNAAALGNSRHKVGKLIHDIPAGNRCAVHQAFRQLPNLALIELHILCVSAGALPALLCQLLPQPVCLVPERNKILPLLIRQLAFGIAQQTIRTFLRQHILQRLALAERLLGPLHGVVDLGHVLRQLGGNVACPTAVLVLDGIVLPLQLVHLVLPVLILGSAAFPTEIRLPFRLRCKLGRVQIRKNFVVGDSIDALRKLRVDGTGIL